MTVKMKDLHDATLVGVHLHWETGTTTVTLQMMQEGDVDIRITDCTEVSLPRREEWGRSVSVMSVVPIDGDASVGLSIEMQSGDRLLIRGNAGHDLIA